MARGRSARGADRGGERIQATRTRTRIGTASASLAIGAGIVVYSALAADRLAELVAAVGLGGVLLLALGLGLRRAFVTTAGLAGIGAAYGLAAWTRGRAVPLEAPVVAAALLTSAELAFWSLERLVADEERGAAARRAALVFAVAAGTVFVGSALLLPAAVPFRLGLGGDVLGVIAAVAAVAILLERSLSSAPEGRREDRSV